MQKELYRRVQEPFRKNGIEFAHRNVTVYLPPELQALMAREADSPNPGAAAAVRLQEEEEQRLAAEAAARKKPAEGEE